MNQRNSDTAVLSINKNNDKDTMHRSEESLIKAVNILKSLSDWNKEK